MAFVDLSQAVPSSATWIKIRYSMRTRKTGEPLVARVWSGKPADAVVIKGPSGDAFVKMDIPQTLSYDRADGIDLSLKVIAYKMADDAVGPEKST